MISRILHLLERGSILALALSLTAAAAPAVAVAGKGPAAVAGSAATAPAGIVAETGAASAARTEPAAATEAVADWSWPVSGPRIVVEPFVAPAHAYGPGHRGIDVAVASGGTIRAPADGVVAFVGTVVDRPLITIDHGRGLVTTFEPVASELAAGDTVSTGDSIGTASSGGHAAAGTVHVGLRVHGVYADPMRMFGPIERAVLLPCCAPL